MKETRNSKVLRDHQEETSIKLDELIDSLPSRVHETPRKIFKDFILSREVDLWERVVGEFKDAWTDFDGKCDCNMCYVWRKLISKLQ